MCPPTAASDAKIAANRANALHSTGPATAQAKERTRLNATRHGLTSHVACMPWEDRDAFNQFCAAIIADYHPEGTVEAQIAQTIAEDHWRVNRVRAIEHNIFALALAEPAPAIDPDNEEIDTALRQARAFRDHPQAFSLVTLYEQRINRNIVKNDQRLAAHQAARRAALAQAVEELELLAAKTSVGQTAEIAVSDSNHKTIAAGGFVFSTPEMRPAIDRKRLLRDASALRNAA